MCENTPPDLTGVPDVRKAETLWIHCLHECRAAALAAGYKSTQFKDVDALVVAYASRIIKWELHVPGTEPTPILSPEEHLQEELV